MAAPKIIEELVARFAANQEAYHSGQYNEAQLRQEFLNPFFEALGWDVYNKRGYSDAYKEVIHEAAIKIGGRTKAPDYCFRVGGGRASFFVEAKKPAVDIGEAVSPAYQLRRYAWSAKLPISILTDFEELAVYDCRIRPAATDKPATARILFCTFSEYVARWDEFENLLSPEAIRRGALDRFVASTKAKKGTAEVDTAFLAEIEGWRDLLARNIAMRNPELSSPDLNFAVQRTIDRIVFLRICEDRGIEPYGVLQGLSNGTSVYRRLTELFHRADERYNSGLFHFLPEPGRAEPPDELTLMLSLDDRPLKQIIESLYYPRSPYEFSVLPTEILGQVYEQFLGKVIRLTKGHQAKVEEKPEVRKAGGVYYTPAYIVDYIVRQTLGELLAKKTPTQAAKLRVLDPACGSGSFLIGAYQYLLDWHRDWYESHDAEKHARGHDPRLYRGPAGDWRLTTAERKRILLNNIYGVDIDLQAVEVTKLSLLLKVLEGESKESVNNQLRLFHQRALPDLGGNIKCGNSLIGPDFYEHHQLSLLDDETRLRVNVFDWEKEFPTVFDRAGAGFDAVIGNPPYIRIHNLVDHYPLEVRYLQERYAAARFGKVDIYVAFAERGWSLLNRDGILGFILPSKFLQSDYGVGLRDLIHQRKCLRRLVDFGCAQVFLQATTYTCLLFLSGAQQKSFAAQWNPQNATPECVLESAPVEKTSNRALGSGPWVLSSRTETRLVERLENAGRPLPEFVRLAITGVKTGANSVFLFEGRPTDRRLCTVQPEGGERTVELESKLLRPFWKAESIKRYHSLPAHRLLLYPYELRDGATVLIEADEMARRYPRAWAYLNEHKRLLEQRQKGKLAGPGWYGLSFSSSIDMFTSEKLVTPTLAPRSSFVLDAESLFFPQGAGGGCGLVPRIPADGPYLLGLLNSRVSTFYFQRISSRFQGGWYAYEPRYLNRFPVPDVSPTVAAEKRRRDRIAELAGEMLTLHRRLAASRSAHEQTALQRQLDGLDSQIDALVYELYGLTDAEIRIVEEATAG